MKKQSRNSSQPMKGLLFNHLEEANLKPVDLAKLLDVSMNQVRTWNKNGIAENNKYADRIRSQLPRYPFAPSRHTKKGNDDNRARSGRHKKQLSLTDVELGQTCCKKPVSFDWDKANKFIPGRRPKLDTPTIIFKKEK